MNWTGRTLTLCGHWYPWALPWFLVWYLMCAWSLFPEEIGIRKVPNSQEFRRNAHTWIQAPCLHCCSLEVITMDQISFHSSLFDYLWGMTWILLHALFRMVLPSFIPLSPSQFLLHGEIGGVCSVTNLQAWSQERSIIPKELFELPMLEFHCCWMSQILLALWCLTGLGPQLNVEIWGKVQNSETCTLNLCLMVSLLKENMEKWNNFPGYLGWIQGL